jgi:hypothetical protein
MKELAFKKVDELDWKELLEGFLSSQEWAKIHPLQTVEDIDMAMDISAVFKADGGTADDKVVDRICEAAIAISFLPTTDEDKLIAIKEFKQYFVDLKATKGEVVKD